MLSSSHNVEKIKNYIEFSILNNVIVNKRISSKINT